jgi:hypothetical protein
MCRAASSAAARMASCEYVTPMVLFEPRLQAHQDVDGLGNRRLDDIDLLEAARERVVFLEDPPVFLVRSRADAAQLAVGEHGLMRFEASMTPPEAAPRRSRYGFRR